MLVRFICLASVIALLSNVAGHSYAKSGKGTGSTEFVQHVKPILEKYCYSCHGQEKQKADLSLEVFNSEADALKDPAIWEKVLRNVVSREMPPENKAQPSDTERAIIAQWIDEKVFKSDCANPDPGRVTIRRLNRSEYNNTIRDLVGVDFEPAADFPADDSGYGFDNIGDVLSVPPVLLEKYFAAAEKILDAAIVTNPDTNGPSISLKPSGWKITGPIESLDNGGIKLTRDNQMVTNIHLPSAGDYLLRVIAWGDQCGDEPPRMKLQIGEGVPRTVDVSNSGPKGKLFKFPLRAGPGNQQVSISYINNYRDPNHPAPGTCDRNLAIVSVQIVGPAGPPKLPESHKRIFPIPLTASTDTNAYARQIVSGFARRAYRRPITAAEVDRLMKFYTLARNEGENFEASVKLSLQAALVSPHFLFRGELQPEPDNPQRIHPVDEFALASRLSYFLWSSMPDDRLFALAAQGKLRKNLSREVRRMLKDDKANALVENFTGQWLQLRNLQLVQPDPTAFPEFDEELRQAMRKETELLFGNVMREDRSVLEFLEANYTFANERLAKHYGLKGVKGEEFRKVKLKSDERGGVLTHASILTLTSNPNRTSPVKRGKWVLDNILGTPPPPPPPDVPELKEGEGAVVSGTLRERMEQHRENPNCASCHARMDPIGFGLENFDGIGQWRAKEGDFPIDPAGSLVSGEKFNGIEDLKKTLADHKREEFARCLTEKMLTYALGRGLEYYDKCAVDKIRKDLARRNYRFSSLVLGIVESTPFQMRRGEGMR